MLGLRAFGVMRKDFDRWNTIKKQLETTEAPLTLLPRKREVWTCILGENLGFEQSGTGTGFARPVLIVKKFNNKIFWVVPLSTKQKTLDFYYNFRDPSGNLGSVILAQMRLVSVKRLKRFLYELPGNQFLEIQDRLRSFI